MTKKITDIEKIYEKNEENYVKTLSELIKENKDISKHLIKIQLDQYIESKNKTFHRIHVGLTILKNIMITSFMLIIIAGFATYSYAKKLGYGDIFIAEFLSINAYRSEINILTKILLVAGVLLVLLLIPIIINAIKKKKNKQEK